RLGFQSGSSDLGVRLNTYLDSIGPVWSRIHENLDPTRGLPAPRSPPLDFTSRLGKSRGAAKKSRDPPFCFRPGRGLEISNTFPHGSRRGLSSAAASQLFSSFSQMFKNGDAP